MSYLTTTGASLNDHGGSEIISLSHQMMFCLTTALLSDWVSCHSCDCEVWTRLQAHTINNLKLVSAVPTISFMKVRFSLVKWSLKVKVKKEIFVGTPCSQKAKKN